MVELTIAPGNLTFTPEGRLILSLHQFYEPDLRVAELTAEGQLVPFPTEAINQPGSGDLSLDSVLGLQCDRQGVVWMLDNAMRGGSTPKLVGWDTRQDRLAQVIELPPPITVAAQFINDLAVDLTHGVIFISDPAVGDQAAVIVVDLETGAARRVLQGHGSVLPGDLDLIMDGSPVVMRQEDGSWIRPHLGVNGIALDAQEEWLYFCPMHADGVYRIRAADLAKMTLSEAELGSKVERYCSKPICDGITIDQAGNLYLGDLSANALGVIPADTREYRWLVQDPLASWLDSFAFGPEGDLYCVSNQLHRSAPLHGDEDISRAPYHIFRVKPLAAGVLGR